MTRALVTGAAGFIGAGLLRALAADGHEIHAIVRPGSDTWRLRSMTGVRLHELTLTDGPAVSAVLRSVRPERIFHTAAHGAYASQHDPRRIIEDTLLATTILLDAAVEVGFDAFVHTGSSSEYGATSHAPSETDLPCPNSLYAVGKNAATMYGRHVAAQTGMKVVTARLYSVYGPLEAPERFIPTLLVEARRGSLPPLGDPNTARDFVYIDDVIKGLAMLAADARVEPGSVFNVGTGRQTTLADIASLSRQLFGVSEEPRWGSFPSRPWDTTTWVANPERLLALGWRPTTDLKHGLTQMMAWLEANDSTLKYYEQRVHEAGQTAADRP